MKNSSSIYPLDARSRIEGLNGYPCDSSGGLAVFLIGPVTVGGGTWMRGAAKAQAANRAPNSVRDILLLCLRMIVRAVEIGIQKIERGLMRDGHHFHFVAQAQQHFI